jgi:hypothetical protein
MDTILTAIIAAIAAQSEAVVKDAYSAFKSLIQRKFGANSSVVTAVDKLEEADDSLKRQETLRQELATAAADKDPEIVQQAQSLLDAIKQQPEGQAIITQTMTNLKNSAVSVYGPATVTVGAHN